LAFRQGQFCRNFTKHHKAFYIPGGTSRSLWEMQTI
jgi:hypothetical protein